jgi:hypothetical protein
MDVSINLKQTKLQTPLKPPLRNHPPKSLHNTTPTLYNSIHSSSSQTTLLYPRYPPDLKRHAVYLGQYDSYS